jgi:hypothetical protein
MDASGATYVWFMPSTKAGHEAVLQHLAATINNTLAQALGTTGPTAVLARPSVPVVSMHGPGPAGVAQAAGTGIAAASTRPSAPQAAAGPSNLPISGSQAAGAAVPTRPAAVSQPAAPTDEDVARRLQAAELLAAGRHPQELGTAMQEVRMRPPDSQLPNKSGDTMPSLGGMPQPMGTPSQSGVRVFSVTMLLTLEPVCCSMTIRLSADSVVS